MSQNELTGSFSDFDSMKWPLSNICKPDKFESQNTLKLALPIIEVFVLILLDGNLSLIKLY